MKLAIVQYIAVAIMSLVDTSVGGSCKTAKLCCQGRDSGCVIQKASPNAIIESPKDKPCYCDHACLKLNDCCDDFRETCSVVDCAVSDWGTWSACDNQCGVGIQTRIRVVTQSKQNGGKHCPQLEQSRICQEHVGCRNQDSNSSRNNHITLLTTWSEVNSKSNETTIAVKGECSTFTVIWASQACSKEFPSLELGAQICAVCRDEVESANCRIGEDPLGPTGIGRWKIMTPTSVRCHGKWIGSTIIQQQCDPVHCQDKMSLVYV